jgi:hypothetical protein
MTKFRFELETAGRGDSALVCDGLQSLCGNIKDGLAFQFGNSGPWVVSFSDFEKLYLMARAYRDANK